MSLEEVIGGVVISVVIIYAIFFVKAKKGSGSGKGKNNPPGRR